MTFSEETDFHSWAKRFHEYYEVDSRLEKEFLLTRKLILTARRWTTYMDALVKGETGYVRAQWETLSALTFCAEPTSVVDLSKFMAIKWPTLIRVLKQLEEKRLLVRSRDPRDGRSSLISITPEGRRVMNRVRDVLDPVRKRVLSRFSGEELETVERMLDELFRELAPQADVHCQS